MAITAALLTASGDATDLAAYATASITPTANRLVLAAVFNEGAGVDETPTLTGNGLTWVQIVTFEDGGANNRFTVFRAMGAAPSAGAVTIDFGGLTQTRCGWSIIEFAAVDTSGTNGSGAVVQSKTATGTGTTSTADFDAAFGDAVNNATYSALVHRNAQVTAVEGSFVELSDVITETIALQVMWLLGEDQNPAPTWTGSVIFLQVIAEIKAATTQNLTGTLFTKAPTFPQGVLTQGAAPPSPSPSTGDSNRMGGNKAIRKPPRNVGR